MDKGKIEFAKTILIAVLIGWVMYLVGNRVQAQSINTLIRQNRQLIAMKVRTEQLFSRSSEELKQTLRNIGYYFPEPIPQKTEEEK